MAMVRNLLILLSFLLLVTACKKTRCLILFHQNLRSSKQNPVILTLKKKSLSAPFRGYYEGLPVHYSESNQRYPLLVFLHGIGQRGDGDGQLFTVGQDGLGKLLETRSLPPNFVVNGKNFSFIYICPQYWETPTGEDVKRLMDTLKAKYRIDISRIYLAGLSVGGIVTTEAAASYPYLYAAISAMGGTTASGTSWQFRK
jgi:predicted peptidase